MTDGIEQPIEKKKAPLAAKIVWVLGYLSVFLFYGMAGAVLSSLLFPDFSFAIFFIASVLIGGKIDYKMKGPASKFEQKFVSQMEKKDHAH